MSDIITKLKSSGLVWSLDKDISLDQRDPLHLSQGLVHEFFLETLLSKEINHKFWLPPLAIVSELIKPQDRLNIWIGVEAWPYRQEQAAEQNIF